MRRKHRAALVSVAALLLILSAGAVVLAQTSADYHLEWHVIGGGGGSSSSVDYRVQGTIGQAVVSPPVAEGAGFRVSSGYWYVDSSPAGTTLYLPAVLRPS